MWGKSEQVLDIFFYLCMIKVSIIKVSDSVMDIAKSMFILKKIDKVKNDV